MRIPRWKSAVAIALCAVLFVQNTPGGMLMAWAVDQDIEVVPQTDGLDAELAAKAEEYPAGAFAFHEAQSGVAEGDGDLEIKVVRWGDASERATVDVRALSLTAEYGEDYEAYVGGGLSKTMFTPAEPASAEQQEEASDESATAGDDAADADGESSAMREAYAIQTGNDTVRTNWRGEYEEYLAPVAAVETANNIVNSVPGAGAALTFEEGERVKTVRITVIDDDRSEGKEAFRLVLGNASRGVLGEQMQHTVSIEDNEESEPIRFAMRDAEVAVAPGAEYAEVTIVRTSGTDYYAGVVFGTAAGTATSVESYRSIDGASVPFSAGTVEQTIQIPLQEGAQAGTYFTVRLDASAINVEEGRSETIVRIEDGVATQAGEEDEPSAAENLTTTNELVEGGKRAVTPSLPKALASGRMTHDGVVYDEVAYSLNSTWESSCSGSDSSAWAYGNFDAAKEATRVKTEIHVWGYTDHWIFGDPAYKNMTLKFGGKQIVYRDSDNKDKTYTDWFNIDWSQSQNNELWYKVNTDGTCYSGHIKCNSISLFFPRYTLTLSDADANPTLKGKRYTTPSKYTQFDVKALSGKKAWSTRTVRRNGRESIYAGSLQTGVYVDKYELYVGGQLVKTVTSDTISYSDLNSIRSSYDGLLRNNKYQVRVKPIYKTQKAKVGFTSQDKSAIAFSGDAGKEGFKVGDEFTCSRIDEVTFTATCPTNQEIEVSRVTTNKKNGTVQQAYVPRSDERRSFTKTVPIRLAENYFNVEYRDVELTVAYTPKEVTSKTRDVGSILIYDSVDLNTPLGVSRWDSEFSTKGRVDLLRNKYVTRVVAGDGFQSGTVSPDGISYSTRTIWTYRNPKTGELVSTMGNALMFQPHYADETLNYHFKSIQDDETPVGVTGTVYIKEKPLFSANARETKKAAVGVQLDVGGETTQTNSQGIYTIPAKFNSAELVSAFVRYGTLSSMETVALSEKTVKNFEIAVDEADAIKVTDSSITKLTNTNEYDMSNKPVFEQRGVSSVLLEDATYTFNITAQGSAGVVPAKAEFYVYDKNGNLKSDKTQTATFTDGVASLELNPQKAVLEVGDSMTVKLFDTKGTGYFEHQTSVILGKKATGMYTFNYEGTKKSDDNLFLKALGNVSLGYDFVLDVLSSNAGTYEDADGSQHQLMFIGFGDGFQNQGGNVESQVYGTLQATIADIDAANSGNYKLNVDDSLNFFGDGNWSFNIRIGIIYDMVMQDSGSRKGEYIFNDYLIIADASAGYQKEWKVAAGPADLTFGLAFSFGNAGDGESGMSVKWHFYGRDSAQYYVEDNASLDLLSAKDITSKGYFGVNASVNGSLRAEFLAGVIGGEGSLKVQVKNTTGYNEGTWNDYGEVLLTPKVKLVILGIGIPVWSRTWGHQWGTGSRSTAAEANARMTAALNEGMSADSVLFTATDSGEMQDLSYTENRSGWNGGGSTFKLFSLFDSARATEGVDETILQEKFLSDSDISVCNLGNGCYLAAFLDVVPGRNDANKMGAYYSVFNGSNWSTPVLLNDDGTEDQLPVISPAGSKGYLIAWSSASRPLDVNESLGERLNTFDIEGRFYNAASDSLGDVMGITETNDEDCYADTNPQLAYYKDSTGVEHLTAYYTKSEFKVTDEQAGEVVGDLLNPDQLNLVRTFDFGNDEWSSTYSAKTEQGIKDMLTDDGVADVDAAYEQYVKDWYGQVFLELAPSIDVSEQLTENGFWVNGTTPQITELDSETASKRLVKESAAISYNELGLLAYSLDKGGMAQTTGDQNLYLQIYNMDDDEFHHPIMISARDAEISDIQFMRSSYIGTDQASHEITWLYWKEQVSTTVDGVETTQSQIKRLDISTLVSNEHNLIKGTASAGQEYYYINKDASSTAANYAPPQVLVSSTPTAEEGEVFTSIGNFQARASDDGMFNYIAWTQPVAAGEGENTWQDEQIFVMREDSSTGEMSAPVQVTEGEKQQITKFDFAVTDDGGFDVLAMRRTLASTPVLDENGKDTGTVAYEPDPKTTELVFVRITPSTKVAVADATMGDVTAEGDEAVVNLTTSIANESFASLEDVVIEVVDKSGKVVYSSKNEEFTTSDEGTSANPVPGDPDGGVTIGGGVENTMKRGAVKLGGGAVYNLPFTVPVDGNGFFDVTLRVTSGGNEVASKRLTGTVPSGLNATTIAPTIVKRDVVDLTATVTNDGALASTERTVAFGYLDAKGNKVELGIAKLPALEPGGCTEFSAQVKVDFADFESVKGEDGSLTDSCTFYLDLDLDGKKDSFEGVVDDGGNVAAESYGTLELIGTPDQVELMESAKKLSTAFAKDDGEGGIAKIDGIEPGETGLLGLTVNGKLAQAEKGYVNRFKVVWEEVDNDVATVYADGSFVAKKNGAIKLRARVMPIDTDVTLGTDGSVEGIDNYDYLPGALIKTIEVTLTVGDGDAGGGTSGSGGGTSGSGGTGGILPGTGDLMSPSILAGVALAGILMITIGLAVSRRKKKGQDR